ncbi:hypothetical protein CAOG_05224 [Capsaspora owczarzaki ATCC 30864]|uniref:Uncharacterized protein n=1 Tax=Capsaspora owczarzaki (strain ATCC 30864) TaxID=595528 RepID=A0A0D2VTM1_CAPO3|nr:hypothetical protein CAOG_05224 [Capsaspora owczarzaki ATCC 30864]KJE94602.1 hypothetical protein CAOG_005224 [Capsaspora owczarzaki ATCC 30864]|eukprot:XP_004346909.1 hypothetical protein CAOG_05224 [Capsaspora owczarzaki ATCC 30864]
MSETSTEMLVASTEIPVAPTQSMAAVLEDIPCTAPLDFVLPVVPYQLNALLDQLTPGALGFDPIQFARGIKVRTDNLTQTECLQLKHGSAFVFPNGGKNTKGLGVDVKRWRDGNRYKKAHNTATNIPTIKAMVYPPFYLGGLYKTLYQIDDQRVLVLYTKGSPAASGRKPATRTSPKAGKSQSLRKSSAAPAHPLTPSSSSESSSSDLDSDSVTTVDAPRIVGSDIHSFPSPSSSEELNVGAASARLARADNAHHDQSLGLGMDFANFPNAVLRSLPQAGDIGMPDFLNNVPSTASTIRYDVGAEAGNDRTADWVQLSSQDRAEVLADDMDDAPLRKMFSDEELLMLNIEGDW